HPRDPSTCPHPAERDSAFAQDSAGLGLTKRDRLRWYEPPAARSRAGGNLRWIISHWPLPLSSLKPRFLKATFSRIMAKGQEPKAQWPSSSPPTFHFWHHRQSFATFATFCATIPSANRTLNGASVCCACGRLAKRSTGQAV